MKMTPSGDMPEQGHGENVAIPANGKRSRGAPRGNQNGVTHGIVAFQNRVARRQRRGRSLIDKRTRAGQNALALRDTLLDKWAKACGGSENIPDDKLILIEEAGRTTYFLDETDRRIFKVIYWSVGQQRKHERAGLPPKPRSPEVIAKLYGYRQPAATHLLRVLEQLGTPPAPQPKTLEQILSEEPDEPVTE